MEVKVKTVEFKGYGKFGEGEEGVEIKIEDFEILVGKEVEEIEEEEMVKGKSTRWR